MGLPSSQRAVKTLQRNEHHFIAKDICTLDALETVRVRGKRAANGNRLWNRIASHTRARAGRPKTVLRRWILAQYWRGWVRNSRRFRQWNPIYRLGMVDGPSLALMNARAIGIFVYHFLRYTLICRFPWIGKYECLRTSIQSPSNDSSTTSLYFHRIIAIAIASISNVCVHTVALGDWTCQNILAMGWRESHQN